MRSNHPRFSVGVAAALILVLLAGCGGKAKPPTAPPAAVQQQSGTVVTIHYYRYDGDYKDWDLWVWPGGGDGKAFAFTGQDEFGKVAQVQLPQKVDKVGYLVRLGGNGWKEKDVNQDRFLTLQDGKGEIWLIQGDAGAYAAAAAAPKGQRIVSAYLDAKRQVRANLSAPVQSTGDGAQGFILVGADGRDVPISTVKPATPNNASGVKDVAVVLAADLDLTQSYTLKYDKLLPAKLQLRGILDDPLFVYTGDDLGATYAAGATQFRVWAPTASGVKLALYTAGEGGSAGQDVVMAQAENGTWLAKVDGDLQGRYYTYKVSVNGKENEAVDPYARAVGVNGNRGLVADLRATDPAGWSADARPPLAHPTDAVLYELHVRDISMQETSGIKNKGKFLGLIERGTTGPGGVKTGLDHLLELGVTHVHLLPSFDYASVDEHTCSAFNWGYDPKNYNTPEGCYATNPDGTARITEFKQMVQGLHSAGLRLVMDVVYNHTYTTGDSNFDKIVPGYYYRHDVTGAYANGSGVGNETASEHPMVRKFIVDSVTYWAKQYHVDGFRFDLMGLHDQETMRQVRAALDAVDPSMLVYGEPWTGGQSPLPGDQQMTKGRQQNMRIAVFNDNIRNAIKGDNDGTGKGYATGAGLPVDVQRGVAGCIDFDGQFISDFCAQPGETINYVSAHDNLTLWDKLAKSNASDDEATRIQEDQLAQAIIFTSQGIPFMQAGEEMLRTKGGNRDSYNAPDSVNALDWGRKQQYNQVFRYYQGLIALRRQHPAFRLPTADLIRQHLEFLPAPEKVTAFRLKEHAGGDAWAQIVVLYNPGKTVQEVALPAGTWTVVADDDEAGVNPVTTGAAQASGKVAVPPVAALVLYQP